MKKEKIKAGENIELRFSFSVLNDCLLCIDGLQIFLQETLKHYFEDLPHETDC